MCLYTVFAADTCSRCLVNSQPATLSCESSIFASAAPTYLFSSIFLVFCAAQILPPDIAQSYVHSYTSRPSHILLRNFNYPVFSVPFPTTTLTTPNQNCSEWPVDTKTHHVVSKHPQNTPRANHHSELTLPTAPTDGLAELALRRINQPKTAALGHRLIFRLPRLPLHAPCARHPNLGQVEEVADELALQLQV